MTEAEFDVRVGGDFACFSRPEFKVERVSYPVITPAAARGVLEAIFWKPEIEWQIRRVQVLKKIKQITLLRNELGERQRSAPIFVEENRQQRLSVILQDVDYVITAAMILRPHAKVPITKYSEQFRRRLTRGGCHHTPYLGNREFSAWFEPASGDERPEPIDLDIGEMLFDFAYQEDPSRPELQFRRQDADGRRTVHGYSEALFFHAKLKRGVLWVPTARYRERRYRGQADAS